MPPRPPRRSGDRHPVHACQVCRRMSVAGLEGERAPRHAGGRAWSEGPSVGAAPTSPFTSPATNPLWSLAKTGTVRGYHKNLSGNQAGAAPSEDRGREFESRRVRQVLRRGGCFLPPLFLARPLPSALGKKVTGRCRFLLSGSAGAAISALPRHPKRRGDEVKDTRLWRNW